MTPYLGEITMFAGNFAPDGWAICDGSELSIQEFSALFKLIGTTYGGDGLTTFALPDLRGRVPIHFGQGNGLSARDMGNKGGLEAVTLTPDQLPNHTHAAQASKSAGNSDSPAGHFWAASPKVNQFAPAEKINAAFNEKASSGGNDAAPHDNMLPFIAVNFIMSLHGIYPAKN